MQETLESLFQAFIESNPEGAAHALERLEPGEAAEVLKGLHAETVGPVAERLTPHAAGAILSHLGSERTQELLAGLTPRQAANVLQHLEEAHREAALAGFSQETARRIRALLQYPIETAGGMMEPQVASLAIDLKVQEAIASLRRTRRELLYYLYVTDREGRLIGVLTMRDLLLASPYDPIEPMVKTKVISVPASMDREEVAILMRQRNLVALPVVDAEGRLIGVVKHDEVLDTVQEEAFEDLQKMVGAGGDESALSPVGTVVKRRLPWLYFNLLTAFAAAAVVSLFEGILAQVTALAILLPIVSGQGGNSGAQTLAVVMRGLALREIIPRRTWYLLMKELLAGTINGLAIAVVTSGSVFLWRLSAGDSLSVCGGFALVIGLGMVVNMAAAAAAGAAIPLLLRRLGRDPAQSASIFLTTVTDIVGFASFLGFAVLFSPLLAG